MSLPACGAVLTRAAGNSEDARHLSAGVLGTTAGAAAVGAPAILIHRRPPTLTIGLGPATTGPRTS